MASTGFLPVSLLTPPADPVDRRDWHAAVEERIAQDMRRTLRRIVDDALTAYLDTLTAAGDEAALDAIIEDWATYVATEVSPTLQGLYVGSSISAWVSSPASKVLPLSAFDGWGKVVNYNAINYQATAANRLVGVGDNLWSAVNSKVLHALETGATNEELKGMIEQVAGFSEYRADTIARTETAAAINRGRMDSARAMGEYGPVAKVWNAVMDARTRDAHAEVHDVTVAFDEMFVVGGEPMDGPHDPSASAANTVSCRCELLELNVGDIDPQGNVWTADGPVEMTDAEREDYALEQEIMTLERMGRFGPENPAPPPLLRPGDDGWEVYAEEAGLV